MATITFTGFVDDVITSKAGEVFALKVAEPHYKKDGDEFISNGRTFFKVMRGWGAEFDLAAFAPGDKVEVSGKQKTESRDYDGKTYYDLVVNAESISIVTKGEPKVDAGEWATSALGATELDPSAPF
jgi:hypothetical protein